jgi:glutathione synthase/RimK-type ligase-like ATP-grasp enzyme
MIALWGLPGDEPFDRVREELAAAGRACVLLDQRDADRMHWDDATGRSRVLHTATTDVVLDAVRSLYTRVYDVRQIPALEDAGAQALSAIERVQGTLWAWADRAQALVLNRPSAMASNNSKPYQAMLIERHGFAVPETLVTTDVDAVLAFRERHGEIIYKSVSGVRSKVARLRPDERARLDDIAWCPTQFQAWIAGTDHRVHVVGDRVFTVRIDCDAVDYRYAAAQGASLALHPVALEPELKDAAVRLAHALGLPLAGLDLRRTPEGQWVCFEVNPSPCFTYYEKLTGQPIARAVADLLAAGYQ